jgi:thiol-disulfide isomerase/thioredoxin
MGSVVPDFDIDKGTLRMSSLKSNYTLLIFWASWCSHCVLVLPEIKKAVEMYNKEQEIKKQITVVAVSLDNKMEEWQEFINKGNYSSWLNTSELKGWNGEVPKKYNVYATPTMFLLDKEKKIIGKPEDTAQLLQIIDTNRNLGSIDHD